MGDDARTRYTSAVTARAARQHGPSRVAIVGEAKAADALAHRHGWIVAPGVDDADALAVALPADTFGGAADTAVRTALRRGLPILVQIGGGLAAFPDCSAVPVPGGYRLRVPAEPGPATAATLAYLGVTPAPKRSASPGHGESPKAAPPSIASAPFPASDTPKSSGSGSAEDSKASSGQNLSNPSASTAEQEAEQALRRARREVTAAAIAKLAPHPIPNDDTEKRSAWLQLVRGGMTPTPAAVAGLVASKAARRVRRAGSGSRRSGRDRQTRRCVRGGRCRARRRRHRQRTDVARTRRRHGLAPQRIPRDHSSARPDGVAHEYRRGSLPTSRTRTRGVMLGSVTDAQRVREVTPTW
jgi:hypothetical protein